MSATLPKHFTSPHELSGFSSNTPILLGFSGGADSTALLHMLCIYGASTGAPIYAAHVHHGIRGEEADRDEEFCRSTAQSLGIPLFVHHADVPALAKEYGESVETTARRVRYRFFGELMREHSISILVTAHNANDNLETMLFNLIRGSGLSGMCGIPTSRLCDGGVLVRPIHRMTRKEIFDYCRKHHLSYVNDSTNTDTDYTRNRIRSEILPQLTAINPCAVEHAARLAETLRSDHLCLESMARMFLEELRQGDALETEKINGSPDAIVTRALRELYREISDGKSLEYTHLLALKQLSEKSVPHSSVTLPYGWEAVIEDGWLRFQKKESLSPTEPFRIPLKNGKNTISQIACEIIMGTSQNTKNIYKNSIQFRMDSAKIKGILYARSRLPGDRIQMSGMHKSIKKLFGEKKIPLALRGRLPILCDDDGIAAIPLIGMRDGLSPQKISDSNIILGIDLIDLSENTFLPLHDTERNRKG